MATAPRSPLTMRTMLDGPDRIGMKSVISTVRLRFRFPVGG